MAKQKVSMRGFRGVKGTVILVILVVLAVGYYFYLSQKEKPETGTDGKMTLATDVLLINLDNDYPPTPKAVVELYAKVTKAFYDPVTKEEQISDLAVFSRKLFDEALVANQSAVDYLSKLQTDVASYKNDKRTVLKYTVQPADEVEYFTKDGYECARLWWRRELMQNAKTSESLEYFVLRKDADGKWKIYGFAQGQ